MVWRRYLEQARKLPPDVFLRKAGRKLRYKAKHVMGRWKARLFDPCISDAQLRAALAPPLQDEGDLLAHLRSDDRPAFFITPARTEAIVHALRQRFPGSEALIVSAADEICEHVFDLLGSGPTHLSERINWHVDFKTGHHYDLQYYADLRPAPYPGGHDIKVPWELSRSQHFVWLGQAYWFTGDEKYAREFAAQVLDWIEQNPTQFGVNWACTMDVAIRAVNWLWGYYFFKDSPSLADEFRLTFFKSLLAHGRHIMNNLEWSEALTSNHYLSDIVGLVYLGILLPEFKEARRWREFGLQELEREMVKQVYPDGVDFEASVSYHRLVTELFMSAVLLARLNGHTFGEAFMDRLEKMLEFTMHVTRPDGTVPIIGDNDNGRLHRLKVWREPEREWVDHRYLLAIGAVLFGRDDFAQAAGEQWEEAIWLLGEEAIGFKEEERKEVIRPSSRAFPVGGLYTMRSQDACMIIDAGSNGQKGNGGHAHNDTLSFELYAYGRTLICDPGAYVYTADFRARNLFRSTAYHNTVVIDGQEMNRFEEARLFAMHNDALPTVHAWQTTEEYDFFDAEHNGYQRLPQPVVHQRQIYFDKREVFWLIRDIFSGEGEHLLELYFHFTPQEISHDEALVVKTIGQAEAGLAIVPLKRDDLTLDLLSGWVSYGYGVRIKAPIARYTKKTVLPTELVTMLYLWPDGQPLTGLEVSTLEDKYYESIARHL